MDRQTQYGGADVASHQGEDMADVKQTLLKYLSYWKWFVLSVALSIVLGFLFIHTVSPRYSVWATLLIKDSKTSETGSMLEAMDVFSPQKVLENEIEIIRSYKIAEQVVRDMNLQVSYSRKKGLRTLWLHEGLPVQLNVLEEKPELNSAEIEVSLDERVARIDGREYPLGKAFDSPSGTLLFTVNDSLMRLWADDPRIDVHVTSMEMAVAALRKNLGVEPSARGTTVLRLDLLSPIPAQGEKVLDHIIDVYVQESLADKNNLAGVTLSFIDERLGLLVEDLQKVERDVEQYKSSNEITDLTSEGQIFLTSVQDNDKQLGTVDIQLGVLDEIRAYVTRPGGGGSAPATVGLTDPTLLTLIASLTDVETRRAAMLHTVGESNPAILALDDQIAEYRTRIEENVDNQRTALLLTRGKLRDQNARLESYIKKMPRKERELMEIARQQLIKNQQYIYLLTKREETAIAYASTVADSRIVDSAHTSPIPVRPVKRSILIVFTLLGLVMPVAVILVMDMFDYKINNREDIEKRVKVPVIGELGHLTQVSKVIFMAKHDDIDAEQIRTLRTNVSFMLSGQEAHTILITSSISGEGKSLISANLGAAYASLGKKTVMLGFDLRKPGLHRIFGLNNDRGLSDYLTGQATFDQIVQKVENMPSLHVISSGHMAPNPQELMQSKAMEQLIEELRKNYEYIVIDTAPVGLVSDAKILDRYAEVTLFVVRQRFTPKDRMRYLSELHQTGQLCNLGIVVNDIRVNSWYGYNSSYGMTKYYGKYYGQNKGTGK
jgi:capsular exopolysaccharide synthesis family protein